MTEPSTGPLTGADDLLAPLKVIDRLEVGPLRLERDRLIAPYAVVQNGREDRTELIYSYEESVFDPAEPESRNLAAVIAAQVALNYGLFCELIVFKGPYDEADRRFIDRMVENTAREIYVKKFLEPNPFLQGEAARLPALKQARYTRARLSFEDDDRERGGYAWRPWETAEACHAVLSSGGKDSLLSFGLLAELGLEVHPIFGNESGRHWFTALNAYRYMKADVPNTTRVWMNSDRVFSWMLRRLPFVRQDFASVRADIYPIRLWTVAVFLFGVLPLLRKRGVGRLLIGDEYDTTVRATFKGITHYDGLYDQSRYFDEALTQYYRQKHWGLTQFSVLRALSELLVQKTLVERYPRLQSEQLSCHAAHKEGERVHPCGNCEKCRRIVGMLCAVGADPCRCGYTTAQIERCLSALGSKELHQEPAAARHLRWMLQQRGLIDIRGTAIAAASRPEILSLRFHPERSPIEAIPPDLRTRLYRIYLEHADGAIRYDGRTPVAFDPLLDPAPERADASVRGR